MEEKEKALRYNQGKPQWSLVDFDALEDMVRVLEYGCNKYAAHNWRKGLSINQIYESMMRHLISFINGENDCPESGLPHVGHICCNAMFLSYMYKYRPDFDDRYIDKNKKCCGQWDADGNCICNVKMPMTLKEFEDTVVEVFEKGAVNKGRSLDQYAPILNDPYLVKGDPGHVAEVWTTEELIKWHENSILRLKDKKNQKRN